MTAMTTGQALVGVVIIIGFFSVLAGFVVAAAFVIDDIRYRWQHRLHPDAGRGEEPSPEGPPAPIFPIAMARTRRNNRSSAA